MYEELGLTDGIHYKDSEREEIRANHIEAKAGKESREKPRSDGAG